MGWSPGWVKYRTAYPANNKYDPILCTIRSVLNNNNICSKWANSSNIFFITSWPMMLRKNLIFPAPAKQRKHSPSLNAEGKEGGVVGSEEVEEWKPTGEADKPIMSILLTVTRLRERVSRTNAGRFRIRLLRWNRISQDILAWFLPSSRCFTRLLVTTIHDA